MHWNGFSGSWRSSSGSAVGAQRRAGFCLRAERARAARVVGERGGGEGFSGAGIDVASLSEREGWLEWAGGGAETAWRAWRAWREGG